MSDNTELQKYQQTTEVLQALSPDAVLNQIAMIQDLMSKAMKKDEHYGVIPGCGKKPTLLKAGAEKLNFTFRLSPTYDVKIENLQNYHRDYQVTCTLTHIDTGKVWGQGVGSCSTLESKYRYRSNAEFEETGLAIPGDAKEKKAEYRKQGFGMKKVNGAWLWVKYGKDEKIENPDVADQYNTVLKMAKKRAQVDATLTATAASDIFTQDIEEMQHGIETAEYTVVQNNNNGNGQSPKNGTQPKIKLSAMQRIHNAKKWFFGEKKSDDTFYAVLETFNFKNENDIPVADAPKVLEGLKSKMQEIIDAKEK